MLKLLEMPKQPSTTLRISARFTNQFNSNATLLRPLGGEYAMRKGWAGQRSEALAFSNFTDVNAFCVSLHMDRIEAVVEETNGSVFTVPLFCQDAHHRIQDGEGGGASRSSLLDSSMENRRRIITSYEAEIDGSRYHVAIVRYGQKDYTGHHAVNLRAQLR